METTAKTKKTAAAASACCETGYCRHLLMCRVAAPSVSLPETAAKVGREVAHLCAGMGRKSAAACFDSLFRMSAECSVFEDFYRAYEKEQGKAPASELELARRVEKVAKLLDVVPRDTWDNDEAPASRPAEGNGLVVLRTTA